MHLLYDGKSTEKEVLTALPCNFNGNWSKTGNTLVQGDNLRVMKAMLDTLGYKSKIDLVYIDPPYATNKSFTIGETRVSTISNSQCDSVAYCDNRIGADFLEYLRRRLILIRELMSEQASIYLHIDCKIGHYVKIIMDEVFGANRFINEITRVKCNPKNFKRKAYGNIKDMILFYSRGENYTWNDPIEIYAEEDLARLFRKTDENGRKYTTIPLHAPGETKNGPTGMEWRGIKPPTGRHWRSDPKVLEKLDKEGLIEWSKNGVPRKKIYADEKEGKKKQDIWQYKDAQYPSYPTEKNLDMLKEIVLASSNEGDLVLDCFCGSGTTLLAAEETGRNWIGIDESIEAIKVTKARLSRIERDLFSREVEYQFLEEKKAIIPQAFTHHS